MALRDKTLDYARGVLMMCVILIHIKSFGRTYPDVKDFIETFTMPVFLFITGFLVNIDKTWRQFLSYQFRLLMPYVVVSTAYATVNVFIPVSDQLFTPSLTHFANALLLHPVGPYWFLYTMMVCGWCYFLSFRLFRKQDAATCLVFFCLLLTVVALLSDSLPFKITFFYFVGAALRRSSRGTRHFAPASALSVAPAALLLSTENSHDWAMTSTLVAVVLLMSFFYWAYQRMATTAAGRFLCFIGRNTLPVYLFHPAFTMAARFVEPLFKFDSTTMVFTLCTLVMSLLGSIVIAFVIDKCRLSLLFGRSPMLTLSKEETGSLT